MNIAEFPTALFGVLRKMDQEATNRTYYNGQLFPTGLRSYCKHLRPNNNPSVLKPRYENEPAWTTGIIRHFGELGVPVISDPVYPHSTEEGDLFFQFDDAKLFLK